MRSPLLLVLTLGLAAPASAEPFVPTDDAQVVERLPFRPGDPVMRELGVLRAELARRPDNLPVAVALARRYVELGRVTGDPRYAGYAQAALRPWWELREPPRDVLVLRATLRQRVHDFDAALADLAFALERNPRDAQARLTRATVLQVRGDLAAARRDCEALQGVTQELVALACTMGVDAANGRLRESYRVLREALESRAGGAVEIRVWLLTALAEMAARAGLMREADAHFKAALAADSGDQYLLAAYADFLLDRGRPHEAAELVKAQTRADGLLLRYALALTALRSEEAAQRVAELTARFDASRMRGDRVHLREEARFELHLRNDPSKAVQLAKANWSIQKEPADARILLEAAIAARDHESTSELQRWLMQSRLEDAQLTRLLASAR